MFAKKSVKSKHAELLHGTPLRRRAKQLSEPPGLDGWHRSEEYAAQFAGHKQRMAALPRQAADQENSLKADVEAIGRHNEKIGASLVKSPAKKATWGETGRYAEATAKASFGAATLRFRLSAKAVAHLHPASIFVVRWDEAAKRFFIIPHSGYNRRDQYAFARISRPGIYTAIGLPRDPRLLTTIRLFSDMSPWLRVGGKAAKTFIEPICQVMLCPDFAQDLVNDKAQLARAGLTPDDFPGGYGGGNPCEQCRSIDPTRLPEADISTCLDLAHRTLDLDLPIFVAQPRIRRWESVGPQDLVGRTKVLAIHPTDGNIVYAGAAGGGVWKTENGGDTWIPTMSREGSLAIGGLAISASDPQTLYAATGEWTAGHGTNIDPIAFGAGIWKTTNGGASWQFCGQILEDGVRVDRMFSNKCAVLAVDPQNPQHVFVGGNAGLQISTDGGASWTDPIFFFMPVTAVAIDPNRPERIYAGVHGQGVFRSLNGGNDWTRLDNGFGVQFGWRAPKIALGRDGPHGSLFVAVKIGNKVFTSTDGGDTFQARGILSQLPEFLAAWANAITVDPRNPDIIYAGDFDTLHLTVDGGQNWTSVGSPFHPTVQSIVFDPRDSNHIYFATDSAVMDAVLDIVAGQIILQERSGGLVTGQFFLAGVSETPPLSLGGSVVGHDGAFTAGDVNWQSLGLGMGGYLEFDPRDASKIFHDTWDANLSSITGETATDLTIDTMEEGNGDYRKRLAVSPTTSDLLLAIRNDGGLSRSTTGGRPAGVGPTWRDVPHLPGGSKLSTVQFASSDDRHAYAGTEDGKVWHSADQGMQWRRIEAGLPDTAVRRIAVDWHDPKRIFVGFARILPGNHSHQSHQIFRGDIDDAGNATWTNVSGADPNAVPLLDVTGLALHPEHEDSIYASFDNAGVFYSGDGGGSWAPFEESLPNVYVSDLVMRQADLALFASTMGRGMYRIFV